ncbi:hypothetical protein KAI87_15045, partial [Myxococcota bacterium]|nr:hypothetical protein [Myxococcota bacterium]
SSAYFVPDVDTIFEIGGQDSKYISVRDGHLADFEMNKICSAGTGSFLEEQAQRLGVQIIGEFAERAAQANRSPDLGTRCTVFMDAEMVRAQQRNASVDSICAGLAYSVARNYIEKVVAGRPIGEKILFQGGTASNQAVVAAFQELLGRPIEVHPHNRVSGAIGAALLAQRASELDGFETQFMGFDSHKGVDVQSFECKHCENRCQVNRIKIGEKTVHFGDACERFSARDRGRNAAHNVTILPNFFTKREELFNRSLENIQTKSENPEPIGLLRSSLNIEYQILWKTMLAELDYEAVLSVAASPKLLRDNNGGMPAELCLPIKVASAQTDEFFAKNRAERLFVPAVLECAPRPKGEEGATCIYAQELGDMLRARYGDKIATAKFSLEEGVLGIRGSALALAPVLNRPVAKIVAALEQGFKAHKEFIEARRELGREALAQDFDRAVIVIGRPYNTHDSYLNLSLSKHLERAGLVAIPWDLLPLEDVTLEERWSGIPWHYNREQLRAIQWLQEDKRFFPLMVSSYGCGPDGFTTKYAEEMLGGFPRLFLEFDEHQAEAGLVTRIEAFSDEIAQYIRYDAPESQHDEFPAAPPELPEGPFIIPDSSEHAEILAAVFRKLGYEASVLLSPDSESIRMGEEHSSGRECHPYTILAGDLVRAARDIPEDESCTFMAMGCDTPCMMRQYGDSHRLLAHKLGRKDMRVWTPASPELFQIMGFPGIYVLNEGFISVDILLTLSTRLRPYEQEEGAIDKVFEEALRRISSAIEKSEPLGVVLKAETNNLMDVPRTGEPGERPVVGVTGDLYTRLNRTSNSNLVQQLEKMGCEVWLNSGLGALIEVGTAALTPRRVREGRVKAALFEGFTWAVLRGQRRILLRGLSERVHELAVEETGERQLKQAEPYVESASSYLVTQLISKSV